MTDEDSGRMGPPGGPARRSSRFRLVTGGALAFVVLASVGAVGGYLLADGETVGSTPDAAAPATAGPVPSAASPTSRSPRPDTRQPSAPTTKPSTGTNGGRLPDLVGQDFEKARAELRERRLGWRLVFAGSGDNRAVVRTDPPAGTAVSAGHTVQLFVAGAAPVTQVPDVSGDQCGDAARELGEKGLYPRYRTGKQGLVVGQDPAAGTEVHWNDEVGISCGSAPPTAPTVNPSSTY